MDEPLLSIAEVAAELSVTTQTVRSLIYSGQISALKIGRVLRVSRTALDEYLASAEAAPPAGVATMSTQNREIPPEAGTPKPGDPWALDRSRLALRRRAGGDGSIWDPTSTPGPPVKHGRRRAGASR
jgi:excisionase family DNA binding protein